MAYLGDTFDATNVAPAEARDLIPPGKYPAQIIESEMKPTQYGQMLKLTLELLDGPHKGRRVWDQLNLVYSKPGEADKSAQTVEIAQRTLSAICHAVGVLRVNDSEALHLKPLTVTVAVEVDSRDKHLQPNDPARRMQNAVKGYTGLTGAAVAPAPRYQPPQAQTGSYQPPAQQQAPAYQPPAQAAPPPQQALRPAQPAAPWRRTG